MAIDYDYNISKTKHMTLSEFQQLMATKRANGKENILDCKPEFQSDVEETYNCGPELMAHSLYDRVLGVEGHLALFKDELKGDVDTLVEFWKVYQYSRLSAIEGSKQRLLQEAAKAYMDSDRDVDVLKKFFADAKAAYRSIKDTHKLHFNNIRGIIDTILASDKYDAPTKHMAKGLLIVLFEKGKPAPDLKPSKKLNARLRNTYNFLIGKAS